MRRQNKCVLIFKNKDTQIDELNFGIEKEYSLCSKIVE